MALVKGNYRLYALNPIFDAADTLVDITVRVNRDIVDSETEKNLTTLATSRDISIWDKFTATQKAQASIFFKRIRDVLPTLDYGD